MADIEVGQVLGRIEATAERERQRSEAGHLSQDESALQCLMRLEMDRARWLAARLRP
jgi:hypothetical protein